MEPDQQLRNLRDFLLVYNRMTEICFQRCTSNFNYRNLTMDEERCVDSCAGKLIRSNHRLMGSYVQLMPRMVQRRMEEMESKAAENAKAAEAAEAASAGAPAAEHSPVTSPTHTLAPEARGADAAPAGFDVTQSTAATQLKLSAAAAALAPAPAAVAPAPSAFDESAGGLSDAAGFTLAQIAGAQIETGSSASPEFPPPKPTSLSLEVPLSTPAVSKSAGSLSQQATAPEAPPPPGQ